MTVATTETPLQQQQTQTSTPVKQDWAQPSHPSSLKVRSSPALASGSSDKNAPSFNLTATASRTIPANTLIARNTSTTLATTKDYSTVQVSRTEHIRLNSDLLYCNHSCGPNVRFVTSTLAMGSEGQGKAEPAVEGPVEGALEVWSLQEIAEGEELRFFYPSTEWEMSQPFRCSCGADGCLGWVDGAKKLSSETLRKYWLSEHISSLVAERDGSN